MNLAIPLMAAILAATPGAVPVETLPAVVEADATLEMALLSAPSIEVEGGLDQSGECGISLRCDLEDSYIGQLCNAYPWGADIPCYCRSLTRFGCAP